MNFYINLQYQNVTIKKNNSKIYKLTKYFSLFKNNSKYLQTTKYSLHFLINDQFLNF